MLHRRLILANLAIHGGVAPLRGDSAMGSLTPAELEHSVARTKGGVASKTPRKPHPLRAGWGLVRTKPLMHPSLTSRLMQFPWIVRGLSSTAWTQWLRVTY